MKTWVLRDPVVYIGSDRSHEFLFSDLISDNCLVFRFSGEACNGCIDFVISRLKEVFGEKYTCSRILLIGSNINERVKENYYGKPVISFTEGGLGLPFEEYNTPFLFYAPFVLTGNGNAMAE